MRLVLFFVVGIVLANIVTATFFWHPKAEEKPGPVVNAATRQGQDPWMVNENRVPGFRDRVRKGTLDALGKPWAEFCSAEGHKRLLDAVNYYYDQRDAQVRSYGNTYGEAAGQYAIKAWTTTDDNRIERLMSETYGRGYFSIDELRPYARTALADVVRGERVSGTPCAR